MAITPAFSLVWVMHMRAREMEALNSRIVESQPEGPVREKARLSTFLLVDARTSQNRHPLSVNLTQARSRLLCFAVPSHVYDGDDPIRRSCFTPREVNACAVVHKVSHPLPISPSSCPRLALFFLCLVACNVCGLVMLFVSRRCQPRARACGFV